MLKALHKAVILVCLPVVCFAAPPEIPPQKTIDLLDENTGLMAAMEGDRVIALYGAPFAVRDQEPSTDAFVAGFLNEYADALGVKNVTLVPRKFCTGKPRTLCADDNDCGDAHSAVGTVFGDAACRVPWPANPNLRGPPVTHEGGSSMSPFPIAPP